MRVVLALGFALILSAPPAFGVPERGGIAGVVDAIADGRVSELGAGSASSSSADTVRRDAASDATTSTTTSAPRPAVNGLARSLMDGGLHAMARERLEEAVRRGEADAETHYLLAESKLAEAKSLRSAADVAAAQGDEAYAARLREEAEARIREGLESLRQGQEHALRVAEERLAAGDLDGAANVANALRHADPTNARAGEILAEAAARREAASREARTETTPATATRTTPGTGTGSRTGATPGGATTTGNPGSSSAWDRWGSDPNSVWDRAVANANRATSTTPSSSTGDRSSTGTTGTTGATTTAGATPTTTTGSATPGTTGETSTATTTSSPMQASESDLEVLARIVKGEALQCSFEGKVAVAAVVLNRVRDPRWPNTIRGVAHQPKQFSCYNPEYRQRLYYGPVPEECYRAARAALAGQDPTGGATHYYNPYLVQPAWARNLTPTRRIGTGPNDTHVFFR